MAQAAPALGLVAKEVANRKRSHHLCLCSRASTATAQLYQLHSQHLARRSYCLVCPPAPGCLAAGKRAKHTGKEDLMAIDEKLPRFYYAAMRLPPKNPLNFTAGRKDVPLGLVGDLDLYE